MVCVVNGEPGFTSEAFQTITLQVLNSNTIIDEMAIRKQVSYMLSYFLINSFCGSERANLLSKCLELFSD